MRLVTSVTQLRFRTQINHICKGRVCTDAMLPMSRIRKLIQTFDRPTRLENLHACEDAVSSMRHGHVA